MNISELKIGDNVLFGQNNEFRGSVLAIMSQKVILKSSGHRLLDGWTCFVDFFSGVVGADCDKGELKFDPVYPRVNTKFYKNNKFK